MKFKVLYLINNDGNNADFSGSFEFYVYQEALNSALSWSEASGQSASLWNGETWTWFT